MIKYLVILIGIYATCNAEPLDGAQCSKYHYEEQILSKQIRMEIRLENLEKNVEKLGPSEVCTACDDGWITFQSSCYLFGTISGNFDAAEAFCKISDGHLVSIRNSRENDFIKGQLAELSAAKFWIGMTDIVTENTWRWIDTDEQVQFYNWGTKQPNNGRVSNCGAIWQSFGNNFVDEPCSQQFRPICKKDMA